jgi:hypothetical protein
MSRTAIGPLSVARAVSPAALGRCGEERKKKGVVIVRLGVGRAQMLAVTALLGDSGSLSDARPCGLRSPGSDHAAMRTARNGWPGGLEGVPSPRNPRARQDRAPRNSLMRSSMVHQSCLCSAPRLRSSVWDGLKR